MPNQIFRREVPPSLLFELLEKICLKTDKYYVVDLNAYRKLLFHNYHEPFLEAMIHFYHYSKQFYVTRKLTYNSFVNIVRHICKSANIMYSSQMIYNKSKYTINYNIYYTGDDLSKSVKNTPSSDV